MPLLSPSSLRGQTTSQVEKTEGAQSGDKKGDQGVQPTGTVWSLKLKCVQRPKRGRGRDKGEATALTMRLSPDGARLPGQSGGSPGLKCEAQSSGGHNPFS